MLSSEQRIHLFKENIKRNCPGEIRSMITDLCGGSMVEPLLPVICSILGMHLFGCKFASERDGDTLPDRKNFDSLLWAIVTVFQVQNGNCHNWWMFWDCQDWGWFPVHLRQLSGTPCHGKKMTQNHKCRFMGVFRLFSRLNQSPGEEGLPRQEALVFTGYGLGRWK